jgi:hypothetical protein
MKKITTLSVLFLLALLWAVAAGRPGIAQAQTNLLKNPSFEDPYSSNGEATNWGRWHEDSGAKKDCATERYVVLPKWGSEQNSALILDGSRSQHIGNQYDPFRAGVYQNVDVQAGKAYRFSAWSWARAGNENYPVASDRTVNIRFRVGVDPNGGGVWNAASVVWSAPVSPHDAWQQATIDFTAAGSKVTVFVEGDFSGLNQCRAHMDVWFDKGELVESGPPPTNTSAPTATFPPATATSIPTATPIPTNTAVPTATPIPPTATPAGGNICVNAFSDANANGLNDSEGYMAGIKFTVAQGTTVVGEAVSSGTSTAACFNGLTPGSYQVAQTLPASLEMTTAGNITLTVEQGKTITLEFGSRLKQQAGATTPAVSPTAIASATTPTPTPAGNTTPGTDEGSASSGSMWDMLGVWGIVGILVIVSAFILLIGLVIVLVVQLTRKQG